MTGKVCPCVPALLRVELQCVDRKQTRSHVTEFSEIGQPVEDPLFSGSNALAEHG